MTQPKQLQLRVLVVDDEALARSRLTNLLQRDQQVAKILEAADGVAAMNVMEAERPDIVFLDIQMPRLGGLDLVQALGAENMPHTIFVTAYDQYAVRAFETAAVDYLVKPFSDERFEQSMNRIKARICQSQPSQLGPHILDATGRAGGFWRRLVVKSGSVVRFLPVGDIDWIEAANVYVNLHVGRHEYLYRIALSHLASKLDPARFVRIHRSTIVNIERVKELEPISQGEYEVVMTDGTHLHLSKTYRLELEKLLGQPL